LTQVREQNVIAGHGPAGESAADASERAGMSHAIGGWWAQLTRPTRVLMSINGAVIGGIGLFAVMLQLNP
jgi:hypothetical protein